MKIAMPLTDGQLCMHFGHCEQFMLVDVDIENKKIISKVSLDPPAHEPGKLPVWLNEKGAQMIIAGGMGQRAQALFNEKGIKVLTGAAPQEPESIISKWLEGSLALGDNICDH
jgi:predicted Fe-Mo cluster-binding NifX family protein